MTKHKIKIRSAVSNADDLATESPGEGASFKAVFSDMSFSK